jgi:hypothetical protein
VLHELSVLKLGTVGRARAAVDYRHGHVDPRGGQGTEDGRVRLDPAQLDAGADLLRERLGDPLHQQPVRIDHDRQPRGGLDGELVGDAAHHLLRDQAIHGQHVVDVDLGQRLLGHVGHRLADVLDHAPHVCPGLTLNVG